MSFKGEDDDTALCEWGRSTAAQLTLHDLFDVRFQAFSDCYHEIGEDQVIIFSFMKCFKTSNIFI